MCFRKFSHSKISTYTVLESFGKSQFEVTVHTDLTGYFLLDLFKEYAKISMDKKLYNSYKDLMVV